MVPALHGGWITVGPIPYHRAMDGGATTPDRAEGMLATDVEVEMRRWRRSVVDALLRAVAVVLLVTASWWIYQGHQRLVVPYLLLAPGQMVSAFLNATGRVRVQAWAGLLAAILNVALSIWWARAHGVAGVIAATVVSYAAVALVPVSIVAARTVGRLREGRSGT